MNSIKIQKLFRDYILIAAVISCSNGADQTHKCERPCKRNDEQVCEYYFEVEKYYVLSKACYECPFNPEDCFREDCISADGVERLITVVNRKLPVDAIHICDGDSVEITVHNMISEESTTIHWHGLHQSHGTPFMDGVGLLTQCPIHPMASFKYSFKPDPAGTHGLHAHLGLQKPEGIFGGFVVRKPKEEEFYKDLYDEDLTEHLMVLNDWTHIPIVDKYVAHYQGPGNNKPDTLLINGRGMFRQFKRENDSQVYYTPVSKFTVKKGVRYRMRVMNAGTLYCPIEMMIDNHKMIVINTDGADIDAITADSLVSTSGERWDFVLEANQDIGNYWIKFRGLADCDQNFNSAFNVAVLHYEEAPDELPKSVVTYDSIVPTGIEVNRVNVPNAERTSYTIAELKSVNKDPKKDPALGPNFERVFFAFDFYAIDNPIFHKHGLYGYNQVKKEYQRRTPQINHISMKMPSFPPLTQPDDIRPDTFCNEESIKKDCTQEFCWCTYLKAYPLNAVVEFVMVDEGVPYLSNHPIHMHGNYCRVVAMEKIGDNLTVDKVKALIDEGKVVYNLIDPIFKDTWTVPRGGYTILRCYLNNPGYWLLHCHLDFHMEAGMSVILKVGEDKKDIPPPPANFPQCRDFPPPN